MTSYQTAARCNIGRIHGLLAVLFAVLVVGWLGPYPAAAAEPELPGALGPEAAEALVAQSADTQHLGYSLTPSSTEPYAACPPPTPGRAACMSIIDPPAVKTATGYAVPGVKPLLEGGGEKGGWDPSELQNAYNISSAGGATQTVAVVDAFHDPNAEADLATFRAHYGLVECGKTNRKKEVTHCFRQLNQKGEEANYPTEKYPIRNGAIEDWGAEISLDLDMVSAICPECKIVLVEANSNVGTSLYEADEEAEKLEEGGKKLVTEISNSWASEEFYFESEYDKYFEHAGIPITAAAGDEGYKVGYPAASKYVISVGGTTLKRKLGSGREWEETVWRDTGGGCSAYEAKPAWQTDLGCAKRTDNDVAAVANNEESPVSVYDSYTYKVTEGGKEYETGKLGWINEGGTSVATPIVAGVEAHASTAVREEGAKAFYDHTLFNVTKGTDGEGCRSYLCDGEEGYNGPTGWGAPDDPLEAAVKLSAITAPAEDLEPTSATLVGYINPEGKEASYHFEYGKTFAYGTSVPVPNGSVEAGTAWKAVSQNISSLEWETTYHYRLVAARGKETVYGNDHTVTTVPWTIQTTPATSGALRGVACTSSTACMAVGEGGGAAEQWNGTEWQKRVVPTPSGGTRLVLKGVSCSSATACIAVGDYSNSAKSEVTVAERWNGTEWQAQTTPNPAGALASQLSGVSCPSASMCMAVGSYESSSKAQLALAEYWNGTEWTLESPAGSTEVGPMGAVSCASSTACMAVRGYGTSETKEPSVAERWNGSEWQAEKLPTPEHEGQAANAVYLYGMSCVTSTECVATGSFLVDAYGDFALAEHWNGTEWQIQSMPRAEDWNELASVSCVSASVCTTVGLNLGEEAFAERWNGGEWSLQEVPGVKGHNAVDAVSCVQSEREVCVAVGEGGGSAGAGQPLVERETVLTPYAESKQASGTSETTATLNGAVNPNGEETKYYFEYGTTTGYGTKTAEVSAGSGTSRVEASRILSGLAANTTYHFRIVATNGKGSTSGRDQTFRTPYWRVAAIQKPETVNSYLWKASCTASSACTAVGEEGLAGLTSALPLVERWNGAEWTIQRTSYLGEPKEASFDGVACASATSCMAIGLNQHSSGTYYSLSESWNGTEWQVRTTPEPSGTLNSSLDAVSCASASACIAVGEYENSSAVLVPFAESWNGSEWKVQSMPAPTGAKLTYATGVSCASASACTMVGTYKNSSSVYVPYAESWNGTEWKLQSMPAPTGATTTRMHGGVSCASASSCTGVGYYVNSSGAEVTLAEHWNGIEWAVQSTPNPTGAKSSSFSGVSCTSSTACIAAGVSENSSGKYVTLAEYWNGTEWQIQSTPNDEEGQGWLTGGVACSSPQSCAAVGNTGKAFAEIYG